MLSKGTALKGNMHIELLSLGTFAYKISELSHGSMRVPM